MIERIVVVPFGPDVVDVADTGLPVEVVERVAAIDVGAVGLGGIGRWVEPAWVDAEASRTLTRWQAVRLLAHERAWSAVAEGEAVALVVESRARLDPGAMVAATAVAESVGSAAWDVLHLDADRGGLAYVLTAGAAAVLLAASPDGLVPLDVVLQGAAVDAFAVDPPLATTDAHDPGEVLVDHLHIVEMPPGPGWDERVISSAVALDEHDVVIALAAGSVVCVASPQDVLAAFAAAGAPVIHGNGPTSIGIAGDLAAGLPGDPLDAAAVAVLLVHVDDPSTVVTLDGSVRDAVHGTDPVVVTAAEPVRSALLAALADGGSRDLVRLLRYRGAADPGTAHGLRQVAPEILTLAFWTPEFCATVVRAAEATGAFTPDEDDPVPGHEVSLAAISPRLYAHLEDDLAVRVMPLVQRVWPYVEYQGLRDAFVIKYAPGLQEELRIHHDVAQLSSSLKLNDGYVGAELEFPRQSWSNRDVPVGQLVVWPSLVTHPHRATPLRRGVKYGLTIWWELPGGAAG